MIQVSQELYLDPALRDWVLLPIFVVMIMVGILRHNIASILSASPTSGDHKTIKEQKGLQRATYLRLNGLHLPSTTFEHKRQAMLHAIRSDAYLKDPTAKGQPPPNPMTDPAGMDNMMTMMKSSMANMVPQMVLMAWINFFFSGFVLLKLPFPLTLRFKQMLQSGVSTRDLDVSWVSSLSWYFLNLFGLQPIYSLLLGDGNAAGSVDMMNAPIPTGMIPPGQDVSKLFTAEAENLELTKHQYVCLGIEDRMLLRYGHSRSD